MDCEGICKSRSHIKQAAVIQSAMFIMVVCRMDRSFCGYNGRNGRGDCVSGNLGEFLTDAPKVSRNVHRMHMKVGGHRKIQTYTKET